MKFGLTDKIIADIEQVFESDSKIDKAYIFGSRAKGNFKDGSDIDIAIKGTKLTFKEILHCTGKLEELNLPYKIDLLDYDKIKEPDLKEHIDRVGIEFYSRWKDVKLGELIEKGRANLQTGPFGTMLNASEYSKDGIPVIAVQDIGENKLVYHKFVFVDDTVAHRLTRYRVKENDIIFGRKGATDRRALIKKCEEGWLQGSDCIRLRLDNSIDSKFVSYQLWCLKDWMLQYSTGATMPSLNQEILKLLPLSLPPLSEQTLIASILSSLDDKIDLLHRQNKTLEQLAETLFRQWFVEESGECGKTRTLGEFIETTLGGEWGKENPEGDYQLQVQCIRGTDIADLETGIPERTPTRFIKIKKFESIEIRDGDLVLEISGGTDNQSTGRTAYINKDVKGLFKYPLVFSNFCRLIRPKRKEYSFFLYSYIHHLYKQGDLYNLENGSSGIKNLNYKALLFELEFKLPDETTVIRHQNNVEQYFNKINKNKHQILTLTKLRDTLLPKLMSGEVRVKDIG